MTSSFADLLRALPDDRLGALLRLRPDLVVPVPADLSALAGRAQSRVSVARALDALDQFTLEVLDGLRLVADGRGVASIEALLALTAEAGAEPTRVREAIDRLRDRFLVYGHDGMVRIAPAVEELTPPYPVGLGRSADELDPEAAKLVADPARLRRTLLSASPEARAVLDRLAAGPPVGSIQPGSRAAGGDSPVRWLVQRHLLVAISDDLVELPREVGIVLRRDTGPLGALHPDPPELEGAPVRDGADSAGAGQALEAVRHLEALLTALADGPASVLKTFGLGARDLKRLAKDAAVTEEIAALLLETAYAAGLLTYTDRTVRTGDQVWLPAPAYDTWRTDGLARRWTVLARAWLRMTRAPSLVGHRDAKDKLINAFAPEGQKFAAPRARRAVLTVLAELPPGTAPSVDTVLARLAWLSPRRSAAPDLPSGPPTLTRAALVEAAALGVTGLDALTGYGRLLLEEAGPSADEDPLGIRTGERTAGDRLVAALDRLVPAPIDHVLIQADLTVVVPGPPEPALAAELALLAEPESRGGAGVYRVTAASVRRGLDAGYAAGDITALLRRRSRTPLPQALEYLIDDVARRHGGLRVGTAGAYLRGEDETLVGEVFADRRLAGLSLRRLAPTVLATPHAIARLLQDLRDAGYAPVPEDASGAMVVTRPKAPRAPARPAPNQGRGDEFDPRHLTDPRLAGIIEQLRLGDRLARAARRSSLAAAPVGPDGVPLKRSQAHTEALNTLVQALRDQARVWVGYVDAQGTAAAKLVRPVSMGSGYLRAEDDRTETLHTFALHRITSAVLDE
jgi:hypothetical protein